MQRPLEYAAHSSSPGPRMRHRVARMVLSLLAVAILVPLAPFICFSLRDAHPNAKLASHLSTDLAVTPTVPVKEVNDHLKRGQLDPSAFYELHLVPGDVVVFVDQLRKAGGTRGWRVQEQLDGVQHGPTIGPLPAWFTPTLGPNGRLLRLFDTRPGGNIYEVYYTPDGGTVFVIWANT
jgi:hypothetical protein